MSSKKAKRVLSAIVTITWGLTPLGCVDTTPDDPVESDHDAGAGGNTSGASSCDDYPRDAEPAPIQLDAENPAAAAFDSAETSGPYDWENVAIKGGGFVTGIVFGQAAPNIIYARTDVGGAYRYDIDAERWIALTDWLDASDANLMGIESIAADPSEPGRVYLAAGTYLTAGNGFILRSSDFGQSFERFPIGVPMGGNANGRSMGERLVVDPNAPDKLYFASRNDGLRVSLDAGETWAQVDSLVDPNEQLLLGARDYGLSWVLFDERDGEPGQATRTVYVGVVRLAEDDVVPEGASDADATLLRDRNPEYALYRSTDAGASWQPLPGQPETLMPHHAVLAVDGMLYLAYNDRPGPNDLRDGKIWQYDTGREVWRDVSPRGFSERGGFGGLSVDRQNPSSLLVTTLDLWPDEIFRSDSSGSCWTRLNTEARYDQSGADWLYFGGAQLSNTGWMGDIEIDPFNPSRALYITGQGIWWSDDVTHADVGAATHWSFRDDGLEETVALDLISPPSGAQLISAVGDIGGFRHDDFEQSPPGGMFENPVFGNTSAIDFAESDPDFIVRVGTGDRHGAVSTDGGTSWTPLETEPQNAEGQATQGEGSVAVAADGSSILWDPRGSGPAVSRDGGVTWQLSEGIENGYTRIASDRVNPDLFYVVDAFTLYVSQDAGASFAPSIDLLASFGDPASASLINPEAVAGREAPWGARPRAVFGHEGHLWLVGEQALLRSTDAGQSFEIVVSVDSALALGFGKAERDGDYPALYLSGTVDGEPGLYRSDDEGETWTAIHDQQHRFGWIGHISGDPRIYGRVYLGTSGRGIIYGEPR